MSLEADLRALLDDGIRERVYEQAAVAVYRSGQLVAEVGTHDPGAVFDVASVTKVATAVLALRAAPDPIPPELLDFLAHRAGWPAWRPFFALAIAELKVPFSRLLAEPDLQVEASRLARRFIDERIDRSAPPPTYSDLSFLEVGWWIETETGLPIDDVARPMFAVLGLSSMRWGGQRADAVRTGHVRPRPGNPSVELEMPVGLPPPKESDDHAVDDDNAAAMGGLCGHAGLWSNARDLAKLGDAIRRCAEGQSDIPLPAERARLMFERVCGSRTCGLDTPSGDAPAIGSILGKGPKGAAGHLGFTGCSLWMDRDAELSIALLSNAVIIERPNPRIRTFRPRVHDLIARALT